MPQLKLFLQHLLRAEVSEVALATGRNPCARVAGTYEIIDRSVLSTDDILQMLVTAGGSRHVDNLGPKPLQWGCRVDTVGAVAVAAVLKDGIGQARFTLVTAQTAQRPPKPAAPEPAAGFGAAVPTAPTRPSAGVGAGSFPAPAQLFTKDRGTPPGLPPELDPGFELDLDDRNSPIPSTVVAPTAPAPLPDRNRFAVTLDDPDDPTLLAAAAGAAHFAADALDDILLTARAEDASDLHLVAGRPPLFRIAGKLLPRGPVIEPQALERMLHPRIPERLRVLLEKDGSCDFALDGRRIGRSRVNVTRQRTGLKAAFRLISREIPTLATLGLPDAMALSTRHHQGLIVITGPTGHGKTTTLAAIIDIINSETHHHIITVEDPVEYVHPRKSAMMSQREVGTHTRSFAAALKASLREDPDVIVVGELRDTETVRMALSASETGHLVLGTMNTPSAAKTIDRLIDLFPPGDQQQVRVTLSGGLRLIVSQRLLPRKDGPGLVAAAEMLPGSVPLWNLIRESKTWQIPSLQQRGKGLGIVRLDDSLADLVRAGKTSLEDALMVADNPEELEALLAGKRNVPMPGSERKPAPRPAPEEKTGFLDRAGALFGKKGGA